MSNHDIDWLAAQQPQQMGIDHGARERALLALAEHGSRTREHRFRFGGLVRTSMVRFAAATGAAAIAVAVIVAVLVLSASGGGGAARAERLAQRARGPQAAQHHGTVSSPLVRIGQRARGPKAAVHHHVTAPSPLVRLAAYVSASPAPAGDATLVARTTTGGGNSVTVYDLYGDNGQYFFSRTESDLAGQVSAHHDLADGLFGREIAAAKLAATGDVPTAAQDMADAPDPGHVISPTQTASPHDIAVKEAATGYPQEGSLFDNWVWENSQDALIAGSGDPQVRAGVLRILATLPGVTVTNGTSGNQPTLVLTAGSSELGYGYTEQLTIDAESGVPIQFIGGSSDAPSGTVDYQVSRVTLANPLANLPSSAATSD
jgi:hypothetical protein